MAACALVWLFALPASGATIDENEPCGENNNGGCSTLEWMTVECGDEITGTVWAVDYDRDTDWFELLALDTCTITVTVVADFDALFGYVKGCPPGEPDCYCQTGLDPFAIASAGEETSIEVEAPVTGSYWFWIASNDWEGIPCGEGNGYSMSVSCGDYYFLCGDVDGSDLVDIDDIVMMLHWIFGKGGDPIYGEFDVNCTGMWDIDDLVYVIMYIFAFGPAPCADCP
jgi:hypothetical protein